MSLLLTLNIFHTLCVPIVNFEQLNACWDSYSSYFPSFSLFLSSHNFHWCQTSISETELFRTQKAIGLFVVAQEIFQPSLNFMRHHESFLSIFNSLRTWGWKILIKQKSSRELNSLLIEINLTKLINFYTPVKLSENLWFSDDLRGE